MIAIERNLKTTADIRCTFYFQFRDGDTIVPSPGILTGAIQLDAQAGGAVITMPPDTENLHYPGLPAGLHTYEIRVAGVPAVRGLLEVLPSIIPASDTPASAFFDLDLGASWTINVEVGTGRNGTNGKDAYEIAVAQGYKGTRDEWLDSLKGDSPPISGLVPWSTYNAHANSAGAHVSAGEKAKWDRAVLHADNNTAAHVSAADRAKWDAAADTPPAAAGTVRRGHRPPLVPPAPLDQVPLQLLPRHHPRGGVPPPARSRVHRHL